MILYSRRNEIRKTKYRNWNHGTLSVYVNQRVASRDSIISRKNGRTTSCSCSLLVDSNGRYYVDIRPSQSSRCHRVVCMPTNRQWTMMYPTWFPVFETIPRILKIQDGRRDILDERSWKIYHSIGVIKLPFPREFRWKSVKEMRPTHEEGLYRRAFVWYIYIRVSAILGIELVERVCKSVTRTNFSIE